MLEVENLYKDYYNGDIKQEVLKGIDLKLDSGFFVLQGPSGSGKSTFLNIVGALDKQTSGKIKILDQDMVNLQDKELTKFRFHNIGFIFQQFNLIPVLNAFENIEYPLLKTSLNEKERRQRVFNLLEKLGMEKFAKKKPKNLSGGQQQRIAIARSLVNSPKIILADEPTASLDYTNTLNIIQIIKQLVEDEGILALIATHDETVAKAAKHIIKLKDGVLENALC